jgi:C4-dicarboxylate-specific signal transduction histidine kinase
MPVRLVLRPVERGAGRCPDEAIIITADAYRQSLDGLEHLGVPMLTRRSLQKLFFTLVTVIALTAVGIASYRGGERIAMARLKSEAHHRLDLMAAAIDGTVNRYAHLPATLTLHPDILALMRQPGDTGLVSRANDYLERLNGFIGSVAIFVLTEDGKVVTSSNWNRPDSFVGEDLSFRPYFQGARAGMPTSFYAIGTTRGEPGYFVSHPITDGDRIIGVAVIKIGLWPLVNDGWSWAEMPAFIAEDNGVVILASVASWRLTALAPLSPEKLKTIEETRQYNRQPIGRFPVALSPDSGEGQIVQFSPDGLPGGGSFLALSRRLPDNGWRLTVFSNLGPAYAQAWNMFIAAEFGAACIVFFLLFLYMRRRGMRQKLEAQALLERAYGELERKVQERTADLRDTNEMLTAEVQERKRAEAKLRAAQDELVQAAKLAVLGQITTSITHELTQPVGALQALSENAVEFMRRRDDATLAKNLQIISDLAQRMGDIIGQLKTFARKSPATPQVVEVSRSIANAQFLLDQRFTRAGITVDTGASAGVRVWCDPLRLEQVLINLMGNAIDAMSEASERILVLKTECAGMGRIHIRVSDTGTGLPPQESERIFEPFYTTKPSGVGLGLGLAISRDILREFGGSLSAYNRNGGGAEFVIDLPVPPA